MQAIENHHRWVRFFSAVALVNAQEEKKTLGKTGRIAQLLAHVDLVILDQLGYLPFSSSGGAPLFHLPSKLYERTGDVITTNLSCSNGSVSSGTQRYPPQRCWAGSRSNAIFWRRATTDTGSNAVRPSSTSNDKEGGPPRTYLQREHEVTQQRSMEIVGQACVGTNAGVSPCTPFYEKESFFSSAPNGSATRTLPRHWAIPSHLCTCSRARLTRPRPLRSATLIACSRAPGTDRLQGLSSACRPAAYIRRWPGPWSWFWASIYKRSGNDHDGRRHSEERRPYASAQPPLGNDRMTIHHGCEHKS